MESSFLNFYDKQKLYKHHFVGYWEKERNKHSDCELYFGLFPLYQGIDLDIAEKLN